MKNQISNLFFSNLLSIVLVCGGLVLLTVPQSAEANTVLRVGPDAAVAEGQSVAGDLYLSAGLYNRTHMAGSVAGDVYVAGSDTQVDGSVIGDVFVFGASAEITASTSDDVRLIVADATIDADIGGDVFVLAGTVSVRPGATIAGDMLVFAGDVTLEGTINGSLFGQVERARVDGFVGGNVDLKAPAGLTLGDNADIAGDVVYEGRPDLVRSQNSVVEGTVTERPQGASDEAPSARIVLTPLFVLLFSVLSLYLLAKPQLQAMEAQLVGHPLINGGIGAAMLFAAPVVAFVFIATVLAAPLGLLLLGVLMVVALAAVVLSGVTLGHYIASTLFGAETITLPSIVGGTVLLYALLYIPVVGLLLLVVTFMVTIGAIVRYLAARLA